MGHEITHQRHRSACITGSLDARRAGKKPERRPTSVPEAGRVTVTVADYHSRAISVVARASLRAQEVPMVAAALALITGAATAYASVSVSASCA